MTKIETFLFRSNKVHWVYEFSLDPPTLKLAIAPFEQACNVVVATFVDLSLASVDRDYCDAADGDLELPWDIIGFDSYADTDTFWRFCLHTTGGEWCFRSRWPTLA